MKACQLIAWLGLAGAARAAGPLAAPDRFSLIGPDYKRAVELPSTTFNPFKSQASSALLVRKETASVTNEAVVDALDHHPVSGLVLSPDTSANRVVLGDEVFGVDEELSFTGPKQSSAAPLIAGAVVVLRAIRTENLEFEIKAEGEAPRRLIFPLRPFWSR